MNYWKILSWAAGLIVVAITVLVIVTAPDTAPQQGAPAPANGPMRFN